MVYTKKDNSGYKLQGDKLIQEAVLPQKVPGTDVMYTKLTMKLKRTPLRVPILHGSIN
jgi:hypothetical protein